MTGEGLRAPALLLSCPALLSLDSEQGLGSLGMLEDGAVLVVDGYVAEVGRRDLLLEQGLPEACRVRTLKDGLLLPSLADCHTHLIWAGDRAHEWRRRLAGVSYTQILEEGGGILSTVAATRAATDQELADGLTRRLARALQRGVTCVEVKSGYGLEHGQEIRLLEIIQTVGQEWAGTLVATWLGAHALPSERGREEYLEEMISCTAPEVGRRGLARFADVYCDGGAYTLEESRKVLLAAREQGLALRLHAEQVTATGAARLAAELGAASADHLERVDSRGMDAMAEAGVRGVLLPGARFFLGDRPPPARALIEAGVELAIASDHNPGSCPSGDLLWMGLMACQDMGLTVEEALRGLCLVPRALLGEPGGQIKKGSPADFAWLDAPGPDAMLQQATEVRCLGTWVAGEQVWCAPGSEEN